MKQLLVLFFIIITSINSYAYELKGRVTSLQSKKDFNLSRFTNLERKKFENSLLVSDTNGLANAVVFIEEIGDTKAVKNKKEILNLNQVKNTFSPRVTAMVVGGQLNVVNSDKIFHNAHGYSNGETIFIVNLPSKKSSKHNIKKNGIISVTCEVHLDMQAYVLALKNPFFSVTDKEGNYSIKNIPTGEYNIIVWHEKVGKQSRKVKIEKQTLLDFTFKKVADFLPRGLY